MRVVILNYYYDDFIRTTDELIEKYLTMVGCAEALAEKEIEVIIIQRFSENKSITHKKVNYLFIKDRFKSSIRPWQIPFKINKIIKKLNPDIIHIHGLYHYTQIYFLIHFFKKKSKIIVQHHAEKPKKGFLKLFQKIGLKKVDSFIFAAEGIDQPWIDSKIIKSKEKIHYIMEGSTYFERKDPNQSKLITKMSGNPIFLWIGNLDENKDPLTILDGFSKLIKEKIPEAKLYMIYIENHLLEDVSKKIKTDIYLKNNVVLIGRIPYNDLVYYYSSSHYFVLGSHYEGSGYALMESLACGVVPIVSHIPPFYMMTNQGTIGGIWQVRNSQSFYEKTIQVLAKDWEKESEKGIDFFKDNLSFDAIALKLIHLYSTI